VKKFLFYEISWVAGVLGWQQSADDRFNKSKKNFQKWFSMCVFGQVSVWV